MRSSKIRLIDVSVGYMTETVINNLSLEIEEGEFTGIFGPNGAGKTTLLCAVNRLARIPEGKVLIDNTEFTRLNENALRRKIGYVPQYFDVDPKLPATSEEVIMMGRCGQIGLFHFAGTKEKRLMTDLADMLEMHHLLGKPFGQLSGGEKKKILIARALIQEPEIMLLDEIFAWLDRDMTSRFARIIRDVHIRNNLTTLMVSHDLDIIKRLCERILWMEEGKIVFDGGKEEFMRRLETSNGIA